MSGAVLTPRQVRALGFQASGAGVSRRFERDGWTVYHCGHPTALAPWAVEDPAGRLHTAGAACDLGRAFQYLADALLHVVRHLEPGRFGR